MLDARRLLFSAAAGPAAPVTRAAGEVLSGLRMLAQIAEHTAAMMRSTEALPAMEQTMRQMSSDTAAATEILPEVEARLDAIQAAMPVLVEVQQHLTLVPEILERLDSRMDRTANLLEQLLVSLEQLSSDVESLGTAVGPLSRLARRVPGRSRGAAGTPDAPAA